MKRLFDLGPFENILPYSSESFGIYQPVIGWKGKRNEQRAVQGTVQGQTAIFDKMLKDVRSDYSISISPQDHAVKIDSIKPGQFDSDQHFGSLVMDAIAKKLPHLDRYDDSIWERVLDVDFVNRVLSTKVKENALKMYGESFDSPGMTVESNERSLRTFLGKESATAGLLLFMNEAKAYEPLKNMFYNNKVTSSALEKMNYMYFQDPIERLKLTNEDLSHVVLSPIGIAHLFRQYFFEFDTFLGPTVGHVWVSPGTTVELIEVSTRKNTIERTLEKETETLAKSEKSITDQDDISEAIKEENRNDTKTGATVTANENWVWGSATQTGSLSFETSQQRAREQTHKHMRQQSEKISTEIKENIKTTFKVVTETTEMSSKRYTISNSTTELANYELRRKMRHVGVQVQDIGTYLCWQTYVDDPGKNLGLPNLVHIAKPADLHSDPNPNVIPQPVPFEGETFDVILTGVHIEVEHKPGVPLQPYIISSPKHGYVYEKATVNNRGAWGITVIDGETVPIDDGAGTLEYIVPSIIPFIPSDSDGNIDGDSQVDSSITIHYKPSKALLAQVEAQNKDIKLQAANEATVRAFKEEYIKAAKERIKLARNIEKRNYEDLREEERIIVYRDLIQNLLSPNSTIPNPDDKTRHILAELLNSIFDIDKMLYFVAPEWWRPRLHESGLKLGKSILVEGSDGKLTVASDSDVTDPESKSSISSENIVGWGGTRENRPDNYYITEDSVPAAFGSSLGWLLQLDGDNMRNAFLNSPWVKAVIPIRPGKEKAAMNWLKEVEGTNGIEEGDLYRGDDPEFLGENPLTHNKPWTLIEVLDELMRKVKEKHEASIKVQSFPDDPDHIEDPKSVVTATPVDRVYEHGFYPLPGGFRAAVRKDHEDEYPFEIFDQWTEVVPTDQIVAVAVKYDPKTGRQT